MFPLRSDADIRVFSHGSPFYQPFFQVIILHHSKHDDKPTQPYIDPIGKAILSSSQQTLELSDIYDYIQANYPYFRDRGTGWRNSIRHNLSLNDCFVKVGRSPNGKGHFWAINPINYSVEVNTKEKSFEKKSWIVCSWNFNRGRIGTGG